MATQHDEEGGVKYLFTSFLKVDDEKRTVTGLASGFDEDLDGEGVDPTWLKKEFTDWFNRFANIREMHQNKTVGKGLDLDWDEHGRPLLTAHILDDEAWNKVKNGLYKAFSIGIKNTKKVADERYRKGRINGGTIIETSVVDRPANGDSMFTHVKYVLAEDAAERDSGASSDPGEEVNKVADTPDTTKGVWTQKEMDELPDSSFAYISAGGTKADRHLPYKDADGKVDLPHLRNALARLDQTDISDADKAKVKTRLESAAKEAGMDVNEDNKDKGAAPDADADDEMKAAMEDEEKAAKAAEDAKKKREGLEAKRKAAKDESDQADAKKAAMGALVALGVDSAKVAAAMYDEANMTIIKDISALAKQLAGQTDKDKDGDVDFPANEEKPSNATDIKPTGHLDEAALEARIMGKAAALVDKAVAEAVSKFATADTTKAGTLTPDTQKMFDELKDRITNMEHTALNTTIKTVAIEREIGTGADTGAGKTMEESMRELSAKAAQMTEGQQTALTAEAIARLVY